MKITRHNITTRKHIQIELNGSCDLPDLDYVGAIVKVIVKLNEGVSIDVNAIKKRLFQLGVVHVVPIVPTYVKKVTIQPKKYVTYDLTNALSVWADKNKPPIGCNPLELLNEIK